MCAKFPRTSVINFFKKMLLLLVVTVTAQNGEGGGLWCGAAEKFCDRSEKFRLHTFML